MGQKTIDIVFDGPPGPESGRFVEVERDGTSISIGEWVHREDGYWVLRIPDPEAESMAKVDPCLAAGRHVCGPVPT